MKDGTATVGGAALALSRARDHLLGLQHPEGWWKAELETNVTMDAEDLLLRHFLGILTDDVAAASARWIRSQQREDGTWATFFGGPPDLSATVEAYVALRVAGDNPDDPHMARASSWVSANGGVATCRVFTRIWLSLFGVWSWEDLPVLPAEIMFLPAWVPLNIYDFACWARQTIVALTVVMAYRPVRPLPFDLPELFDTGQTSAKPSRKATGSSTIGTFFNGLDRVLHRYERLPGWVQPRTALRRAALRKAERWILQRQEADGCWGGIQPPLVYSVIALHLRGYPLDHPAMQAAIKGMEGFVIHDDAGRRIEACQSPVWDTALAVVALCDSGLDGTDPAVAAAAGWLVREEIRVPGDWSVRRPELEPGGWAFEFENDNYPDIDDTAEVVLALRRAGAGGGSSAEPSTDAAGEACRRGVSWTVAMQSRDGGWGAFDVDNDSRLVAALPFCDFGEVTDPPSADVTAHVIEMLAEDPRVAPVSLDRGVKWLLGQQEPDGSWFGRWGVNHVYGTGAAVPALVAAGMAPSEEPIRRAVAWLESHQNANGGWGEDLRSYVSADWRGRGVSTPSQTAWALLALLAAGERHSAATKLGVEWLVANQTPEGTWDEPYFTGTGFPWDFSINYHLYRLVWPLTALGRYVLGGEGSRSGSGVAT